MIGVWFRKCLRLHDNAALIQATQESNQVVPFFIIDPFFIDRSRIGVNRYQFLLESLRDLDEQLTAQKSRLLVLRGSPEAVLEGLFQGDGPFKLSALYWEFDSEPYAKKRDARVKELAKEHGVRTSTFLGHTLLDLEAVVATPGFKPPISMKGIQALLRKQGPILEPQQLTKIPPLRVKGYGVPDISEFYDEPPTSSGFPGGEREALRRLEEVCSDVSYICEFEKPKTASTGRPKKPWEPSTTGLSPYFKFGCISVRTVWSAFEKCYSGRRHSEPPQSLHGQLLFREMFYVLSAAVPRFDQEVGNCMCKEIPWGEDPETLAAWADGRTGYPYIDALMRQLRTTGFMHHLGRHAVACFLTRGDLWQSWTRGRDVFDKLLLDADWAMNNGNWLWLAGVAPFSAPYFRVYDPCPGPKSSLNAEQSGEFVRHFVPELKEMPSKYIYSPWEAPLEVQKRAGCIIGVDYPSRIVEHKAAREANLARFKAALTGGPLPEKFRGREDPGPMASKFSESPAPAPALRGAAKGKGKRANDAEEPAPDPGQQKLRRWAKKKPAET